MNAPEPILRNHLDVAQSTGIDLVVVARGGATALLTTLFKLNELQDQLPHHLTDYDPYYLADSAGAYAVYGLVAPSLADPKRPCMTSGEIFVNFLRHSSAYLSPNRELAREALIAHAGKPRISDALSPVTFSTVDITDNWKRAYFTHFPKHYLAGHPQYVPPANSNHQYYMNDAVLASSAYALLLGEHRIEADASTQGQRRRAMDMAFTENHSDNLLQYALAHNDAFPKGTGRKVVCIILGNNFLNFKSDPEQALSAARVNKHLPDIVRYLSHSDLVTFTERLFGAENVFDLTLMMPQDVGKKNEYRLPPPFRGDPEAILRRYDWTNRMLQGDEAGHERISELAKIIRTHAKPRADAPTLNSSQSSAQINEQIDSMRERVQHAKVFHLGAEFAANIKPAGNMILSQAQPAIKALSPITHGIGAALKISWTQAVVPAAKGIGSFLVRSWYDSAPARAHAAESLMNKLLPPRVNTEGLSGFFPKPPEAHGIYDVDSTPPLLPRSSEQHTPSGFEHRLP